MTTSVEEAGTVLPGALFGTFRLPADVAFVVDRAEGAELFTQDGRQLIDYVLGSGPMVVGHAHPRVVEAIREQAGRGTTFYTLHEPAVRLAQRIVELVPCAEAVKFCSDGTEATFYALRIARAFTGRTRVLKFEGGYHGTHDYALQGFKSLAGDAGAASADSAGIPTALSESMLIAPFNDLEATRVVARAHAGEIAAVITEPVQRSIPPEPGFLAGLRALCDEIGALLVFDEVVTGFRLAPGGAQEAYGVRPDLAAIGKVVGGGLPLAAVVGRRDAVELTVPGVPAERAVYLSGTLNGNPLAAAAGLATLDVLFETGGPERLAGLGGILKAELEAAARRLSVPFQMLGPPSFAEPIFDEEPVRDYRAYLGTNRKAAAAFGHELLRRGLYVNPGAKLYVSTAHTEAQLDMTAEIAVGAMQAVRDQGLLG